MTLEGSPPNAAMYLLTQRRAARSTSARRPWLTSILAHICRRRVVRTVVEAKVTQSCLPYLLAAEEAKDIQAKQVNN